LVVDKLLGTGTQEGTGVAYVYLDYANRVAQTVENVIASLLKQLSLQMNGVYIRELYEQCQRGKSRPDLSKLEATLQAVCNRFERVFFILDALDEYEGKRRLPLLTLFESLNQSRCRFFLTSRPHLQDLQRRLRSYPQIEIKAQDLDIELLVQKRVEEDPTLSELVEQNMQLKEKIVAKIIEKANNM
jgi:hypothetical protein